MLIRVDEGTMLSCCLPVIGTVWHESTNNRTVREAKKRLFIAYHLMRMHFQDIYFVKDLLLIILQTPACVNLLLECGAALAWLVLRQNATPLASAGNPG